LEKVVAIVKKYVKIEMCVLYRTNNVDNVDGFRTSPSVKKFTKK